MAEEVKYLIRNRKARYEYKIVSTYEAGIALRGTEVKSLRQGKANLLDSFAQVIKGEVWLLGAHISEYTQGNINNHDPLRDRRLLLNRHEIRKIESKVKEKGFTLIPLSMYLDRGKVKVELGLCTGKKLHDKRETIAKRDFDREQERRIKF